VGPTRQQKNEFKINPKSAFLCKKIGKKIRKNPRKLVELGNPVWNNFYYCNFFQISTDFELFKRSESKLV
jgi:hypothetical protein